jgi:cysteate synthase
MRRKHKLLCLGTQDELLDDGIILENPQSTKPALLRAVFGQKRLEIRNDLPGIYKFSDWLPIARTLKSDGAPVTYKSRRLGKYLGLKNLYITLTVIGPEIGATMRTGTFKECEAYAVCARFPKKAGTLVVASAGNTAARAFMKVASENSIPLVIVVPKKIWTASGRSSLSIPASGSSRPAGNRTIMTPFRLSKRHRQPRRFVNEGRAAKTSRAATGWGRRSCRPPR